LDDIYTLSYLFGWGFSLFFLASIAAPKLKAAPPNWTRQRVAQNAEVGRRKWKEAERGDEEITKEANRNENNDHVVRNMSPPMSCDLGRNLVALRLTTLCAKTRERGPIGRDRTAP
jgi:hypothetical protein